jgi:hypothetical protein
LFKGTPEPPAERQQKIIIYFTKIKHTVVFETSNRRCKILFTLASKM